MPQRAKAGIQVVFRDLRGLDPPKAFRVYGPQKAKPGCHEGLVALYKALSEFNCW